MVSRNTHNNRMPRPSLAIKYKDGIIMVADNLGSSYTFSMTVHPLATLRSSVRVATCPTFNTLSTSSTASSSLKKSTYKTRIHSVARSVREYLSRMMCQRRSKFDPL